LHGAWCEVSSVSLSEESCWNPTWRSWCAPRGCLWTRTFPGLDKLRALGTEHLQGTVGIGVFCQWWHLPKACFQA
jgi:hypothetical protein